MKAIDLSYYIVKNAEKFSPEGITPLKLQKLIYYVYVWGIVAGKKVIEDNFEKWPYGPVNRQVYSKYKNYGKEKIMPDNSSDIILDGAEKKFVDFILSNYAKFDAVTLSAMTHKESPWQNTETNSVIDETLIKNFYSKLNFAKNFLPETKKYFYAVETDLHACYSFDVVNDSEKSFCFGSYNEYLELEEKNKRDFENGIDSFFRN